MARSRCFTPSGAWQAGRRARNIESLGFHTLGSAFFKTKRHSLAVDFPQEVRILPGIVLYFLESVEVIRSGSGAIDGQSTVLIRMGGASSVLTLDAIPFFPVVEPVRNRVSPSPAIQRFRSAADNAHTVS